MISTSIITIGDELLIGQVIDTNSAWMAQELGKHGISIQRRVAIADEANAIENTLEEESKTAQIILITGGLGPTADDITKNVLCKYFGGKMVMNTEVEKNIEDLFINHFKREFTERNRQQAMVPDVCTVIANTIGTAPGMIFQKNDTWFVSMPGVPQEMMDMMQRSVIPFLVNKFSFPHIMHRTLVTFGLGESSLADMLISFEENLPAHIKLAYLPNYGIVRLRLSGTGTDENKLSEEINDLFQRMDKTVQEYVIAREDLSMENILAKKLLETKKTLSTAESCTGGYIAHLVTMIPGSSAFFEGSVVSYSYNAKEKMLGVKHETLLEYGAVSEEVVKEMAAGSLNRMETDYTIAVSGIMGPGGGMAGKPVGMVWVAVGSKENIITKKFQFRFKRKKNIELTAMNALNLLRQFIEKENG